MDNKQKLSLIKHISQKIFINKASQIDTKMRSAEESSAYFESFAADSLIASTTFVRIYNQAMRDSGVENETDVPS